METLGLIAASAAALAGLVYIARTLVAGARRVVRLYRLLDAGMDIIHRELDDTDPGGVKDDIAHIAIAVGLLQRQYAMLSRNLVRVATLGKKHHPEDDWIYPTDGDLPP